MAESISTNHRGVSVPIRKLTAIKNGVAYTSYEIADYSSGRRVRHQRSNLDEAKAKAKEVCECLAAGKRDVLQWSDDLRIEIRHGLKLLEGTRVGIDRACAVFADALKILPEAEILPACRAWKDKRPNRRLMPKKACDAVSDFLSLREKRVSERRYRSDRSYLGQFEAKFGERMLHEITTLELKDWAISKGWSAKTKKDALGLVRQLYADAVERNHAAENPVKIGRENTRKGQGKEDIKIFRPEEVQRILDAVEDRLKPFFAVTFFSGLRKEEASRLTIVQVREGLQSGGIFLPASMAKTNRSRTVSICANLGAWLNRYLPLNGTLLPVEWQAMRRLDELPGYASRKSGVPWQRNGPRHSFGTYFLRLTGDPGKTTAEMGNSLAQLDRHYHSHAKAVTREVAETYFAIVPKLEAKVVQAATMQAGLP